jgi:predicted ATP-dependent endonuclease of OLD family
MRLERALVQNFRSIVNSTLVDIDNRVTVIVGKNEQGKSNFLKALSSFDSSEEYGLRDLPNHLRADLERRNPSEIPVVSLWFCLSDPDREALRETVPGIEDAREIKIARHYDGSYEAYSVPPDGPPTKIALPKPDTSKVVDSIKQEVDGLNQRLEAHAKRFPPFARSRPQASQHIQQLLSSKFTDASTINNLCQTFFTAIKGLPNQDPAIQADIATAVKSVESSRVALLELVATDPLGDLMGELPHFVFHSTVLDRIPDEVSVTDFVKNPEGTSKGMANLCKAAGLSTQKIQELSSSAETQTREAYEDHYRASISGGLNEFWTQEAYQVHFRIDDKKLSVSISDTTYSRRIPPSDRSDGFQWYLSFYSALLSEVVSESGPLVLLLDNPGLELHADGQHDIRRFLEERLPETNQVIYVTHSPAMINSYRLEQVRKVDLKDGLEGSKISRLSPGQGEFDLLEPVRSAIGASLIDTLMTNDYTVLVEGAADKPILEGAFELILKEKGRKFVVNGSVSETNILLPRFYERTHLPFVVLLDADSGGRELGKMLIQEGISKNKIVGLESLGIQREGDFELEDVLSSDFYFDAVSKTYPDQEVQKSDLGKGKCSKQYEDQFKERFNIGFNKRRVGETVKRALSGRQVDDNTKVNLGKVVSAICKALNEQTSAPSEKGKQGGTLP